MLIISWGDNLHEMSVYFLRKNNLLSVDSAKRVVKVNEDLQLEMCQFDTDACQGHLHLKTSILLKNENEKGP